MDTVGTTEVRVLGRSVSTRDIVAPDHAEANTIFLVIVEESTSLVMIPEGFKAEGYPQLRTLLLAHLKVSRRGVLATSYLDAEEYGAGQTEQEAVFDLVSSLAEYKVSLEEREGRLSDGALADLAKLRRLF